MLHLHLYGGRVNVLRTMLVRATEEPLVAFCTLTGVEVKRSNCCNTFVFENVINNKLPLAFRTKMIVAFYSLGCVV